MAGAAGSGEPARAAGSGQDEDGAAWVEDTLARLTRAERVALCAGAGNWTTVPVERAGVPALKMSDGPNGARGDGESGATAACFPVGTALGATWDTALLTEVGAALARETRTKGAQVLLGPTVNLHRSPLGGRNFECFSEDPLLTAHLAAAYISGLQGAGVGACLKHYVGNESEYQRFTISSEIPERALRELYLLPFEHAVATAEPWAVMGAYNRVGGHYACAHDRLVNGILKGEWGFTGLLVSDWGAVHDTVGSATGGCDLEMPGPARHFGDRLLAAVEAGDVDDATVADKARRVLRTLWRSGQVTDPVPFDETSEDRPEDRALIRRAAAGAMVLLVNRPVGPDGVPVLPLDPAGPGTVAVIGPNAERAAVMGGGSSIVRAHHQVHPLDALRRRLGDRVVHAPGGAIDRWLPEPEPRWFPAEDDRGLTIEYVDTADISAEPAVLPEDRRFGSRRVRRVTWTWMAPPDGAPAGGGWGARWTGTFAPDVPGRWTFGVAGLGRCRVLVDGEVVCDNWTNPTLGDTFFGQGSAEVRGTVTLAAGTGHDVVVELQVPANARRAAIRFGMGAPEAGDPVAEAVARARAAQTAIVIAGTNGDWETEGSDRVDMRLPGRQDELIVAVAAANPRTVVVLNTGSPVEMPWVDDVAAVVQVWFGGQELGDALADVLTGLADPGGRLPTTFPVRWADSPAAPNYPGEFGEVRYGEGVFVGYRAQRTFGPAPLFPFGHGLSYTSFAYGDPTVEADAAGPAGFTVTVPVTNTGGRPGSTVVQLYVRPPRGRVLRPERELKAFAKVHLDPGATTDVRLTLDHRAFAHWDPTVPGWASAAGRHDLLVATSSTDVVATVAVDLPEPVIAPVTQ
jgi:beta-glucosidase